MSDKHTKESPVIPGENETVDAHTLRLHGLSSKVNRPRAFWLARTEKEVAVQVATFISAGNAYRLQFPAVFNSPVPFNLQALSTMFDRYQESVAAQERLVSAQRATTGFKNAVFWGMGDGGNTMAGYPGLAAPRAVSGGFVPPTDAVHTGIVPCMIAMADLLVTQPGYEAETIGRRFGIVPTASGGGSGEDPATLSPGGTARWTGSDVVLTFRAPRGVAHGVEMVQILCDRGSGAGAEFVASTTHASFTDHHPLPPAGQRATYVYYLCFLDKAFQVVGMQSECSVVVQGRVVAGTGADPAACPVPAGQ